MKFSFFTAISLATIPIISCGNLTTPESVSIKTEDAKYSIPLGTGEFLLAEKFSAESIQDAISNDGSNITVYEFNPTKSEDSVIEYIMNYPIEPAEVPVTIGGKNLSEIESSQKETFIETLMPNDGTKYIYNLAPFNSTLDTGLNFKEILESFANSSDEDSESERTDYSYIFNKIKFSGIEAFAYIRCANIEKENIYFEGTIYAQDDETSPKVKKELAKSNSTNHFSIVKTDTDLSKLANEDSIIESDDFIASGVYSIELNGSELSDYVNGTPDADGNLVKNEKFIISYNLTPTLKFDSKESLKNFLMQNDKIVVDVNIILRFPLKIEVLSDIEIDDVLDLAGNPIEDDLLKRDEDDEDSKIKEYSDIVESISLDYKLVNTSKLNFTASLISNEVDNQKIIEEKKLSFNGAKNNIEFSKSDIKNIFEISPFLPKISTVIKKSDNEISITRDAKFGVWGIFKTVLDGQVEIWNKNEKD